MVKKYSIVTFPKIFLYEQQHSANKRHSIFDDGFYESHIIKFFLVILVNSYIFSQNFE